MKTSGGKNSIHSHKGPFEGIKGVPQTSSSSNYRASWTLGDIDHYPAQHEAKTERGLIWKDCGVGFCQVELTPLKSMGDLQSFEKLISKKNAVYWNEKDRVQNEKKLSDRQYSTGRNQTDKSIQLQKCATFLTKERTQRVELSDKEIYYQILKTNKEMPHTCSAVFQIY